MGITLPMPSYQFILCVGFHFEKWSHRNTAVLLREDFYGKTKKRNGAKGQ